MIHLDAACLVALGRGEAAAPEVDDILRRGDAAMNAVNLAEAMDVLVRKEGSQAELVDALAAVIEVRPVDRPTARTAALLRAKHYHRSRCPVSIADCFLLAAPRPGEMVATSDQAVVDVAVAEGMDVLPLPDSSGITPRRRRARS